MKKKEEEIKEKMAKLDKRTKEYKEFKRQLKELFESEDEQDTEVEDESVEEIETVEVEEQEINSTEEEVEEEKDYKIPDEVYHRILTWNGRITGEDVLWIFKTYNKIFGTKREACSCPGVIKQMVAKITVTGRKEREE